MDKNKLVIDPHGRNHFKFMPDNMDGWPQDEGEQLKKIESIYKDLVKNGVIIYTKSKKGSYSIKNVKLGNMTYIVVCIKNEFETYNNVIYEIKSEHDALEICKVIGKNILTMMTDYKKMMLEAKKKIAKKKINIVRKEEQDEEGRDTSESDDQ